MSSRCTVFRAACVRLTTPGHPLPSLWLTALIGDGCVDIARPSSGQGVLRSSYGKPKTIVSDNGTELTSNAILRWTDDHKVEWHYIAPSAALPVQEGRSLMNSRRDRGHHRPPIRSSLARGMRIKR